MCLTRILHPRTAVAEGFIAINDAIYERIAAGTMKRAMSLA